MWGIHVDKLPEGHKFGGMKHPHRDDCALLHLIMSHDPCKFSLEVFVGEESEILGRIEKIEIHTVNVGDTSTMIVHTRSQHSHAILECFAPFVTSILLEPSIP